MNDFKDYTIKDLINHIKCYNNGEMPWLNNLMVLEMKQELRDRKLNQLLNK